MKEIFEQIWADESTLHVPPVDRNTISVHVENLLTLNLPKAALVIEDEPVIKDNAVEIIWDAWIPAVYSSMTIFGARAIIDQFGSDIWLIYCDFRLPDWLWHDFIREIRAQWINAPVIFSTWSFGSEIRDKIAWISDTIILPKPFWIDELEEARSQWIVLFNQLQWK